MLQRPFSDERLEALFTIALLTIAFIGTFRAIVVSNYVNGQTGVRGHLSAPIANIFPNVDQEDYAVGWTG